jgi:hypothetical protein
MTKRIPAGERDLSKIVSTVRQLTEEGARAETAAGGLATTIAAIVASDMLVKTANATFSAERVVTDTATITWDWATAGQAKANFAYPIDTDTTLAENSDSRIPTQKATKAYVDALTGVVPKAVYAATVTPTALGINASAVNTTTEAVTFTAHGRTTGESVVLTGTVPTGLTTGRPYYIYAVDANNLTFHTTRANALTGTSPENLTTTTTGWSFNYFAIANARRAGLPAVGAFGGLPGTTTIAFEFNLDAAPGDCYATLIARDLNNTSAGDLTNWSALPTSVSGTVITFSTLEGASAAAVTAGTWAQQSTTPFKIALLVF